MLQQFPYTAMVVTGVMHGVAGFGVFIITCIGLDNNNELYNERNLFGDYSYLNGAIYRALNIYLGFVLVSALWMMLVGLLGILTGIKRDQHQTTNCLKIGYMVTSILSAALFSPAGISYFAFSNLTNSSLSLALWCSLGCIGDFVLSIVSASICCCCANTSSNTTGTVIAQAPQGNYPPGTYLTGNYPVGSYPPGTYPAGAYPPGAYPPGAYPPGNYPTGNYPNGTYPLPSFPVEGQYPVDPNTQPNEPPGINPA